jgi:hypothetical protein
MSKKFIVALHGAPDLRDPITEHLMSQGWHVWHWYADLWLISDAPDSLTAANLHRDMESKVPGLYVSSSLVMEMGAVMKYYGRAPKAHAWDWMNEHWGIADLPSSTHAGIITGEVGTT